MSDALVWKCVDLYIPFLIIKNCDIDVNISVECILSYVLYCSILMLDCLYTLSSPDYLVSFHYLYYHIMGEEINSIRILIYFVYNFVKLLLWKYTKMCRRPRKYVQQKLEIFPYVWKYKTIVICVCYWCSVHLYRTILHTPRLIGME